MMLPSLVHKKNHRKAKGRQEREDWTTFGFLKTHTFFPPLSTQEKLQSLIRAMGGVGKLVGSIVAAMAIGTLTYLIGSDAFRPLLTAVPPLADFFTFFSSTSMAKVMVFALIVVFLQVRPAGLFPQKGRTVDA